MKMDSIHQSLLCTVQTRLTHLKISNPVNPPLVIENCVYFRKLYQVTKCTGQAEQESELKRQLKRKSKVALTSSLINLKLTFEFHRKLKN